MPQLLLICIQIICFCLTWALITFELQPFADGYQFFFGTEASTLPEWTVHANYLCCILFLLTGIAAILRLKFLKQLLSASLTFLLLIWICLFFNKDGHIVPVLKYSYIVLIPFIFQKIFQQNVKNIDVLIKTTLQVSLIYIPFYVGWFVFNSSNIDHIVALVITSTLTLVSVGASFGLYIKDYFRLSLRCAEFVFFIGFLTDIFQWINTGMAYNRLPMVLIGISLILFGRWVRIVSK